MLDGIQVVSVDASKLVLEAFKLMKEKGIGGLPVVAGPDHHIVGSISVRDVRFLLLKSHLFARRRLVLWSSYTYLQLCVSLLTSFHLLHF